MFARVYDDGVDQGIGGFIVVRDDQAGTPRGLIVAGRERAMGIRGIPEAEILFEDLEVADEAMLVPPDRRQRGFALLMQAYNAQRVGAAAVALGLAAGANELAVAHAKQRRQFGRPISEFQGIQWMLADMATQLAAAQALVYKAAAVEDGEFPDLAEAAQAKILAAEAAIRITNDALQIHGAAGYSRDLPLERMVRDARMFTISGGTAQVLRTQLASRILGRKLPQTRDGYLAASN